MKSSLLFAIVLFLICTNDITAQIDSKKFFISGNFNFSNKKSEHFPNSSTPVSKRNSFGFNPNFGFMLSRNMIIGVGFDFQQTKTQSISQYSVPPYTFFQNLETFERKLGPSIFFNYQWEVGEKFILGINNKALFGMEGNSIEDITNGGTSYSESKLNYGTKSLEFLFSPQIQFMITKSLGFQTNFNLLRIMVKEESKFMTAPLRTTEFDFNLDPEDWDFGLILYL